MSSISSNDKRTCRRTDYYEETGVSSALLKDFQAETGATSLLLKNSNTGRGINFRQQKYYYRETKDTSPLLKVYCIDTGNTTPQQIYSIRKTRLRKIPTQNNTKTLWEDCFDSLKETKFFLNRPQISVDNDNLEYIIDTLIGHTTALYISTLID